jgi:hypothetical protein
MDYSYLGLMFERSPELSDQSYVSPTSKESGKELRVVRKLEGSLYGRVRTLASIPDSPRENIPKMIGINPSSTDNLYSAGCNQVMAFSVSIYTV